MSQMENIIAWDFNKNREFIGQRMFYAEYKDDIMRQVFETQRLQDFIYATAVKRLSASGTLKLNSQSTEANDSTGILTRFGLQGSTEDSKDDYQKKLSKEVFKVQSEVYKLLQGLSANISNQPFINVFGYVVNGLLRRMYNQGIHIQSAEVERLRRLSAECVKKNIPILFLPCHKSHIDYIVISFLFHKLGIMLPHVAAGDNLNLPFAGDIMKKCGAFFLRRSFGDDPLYQAVFKEYIETLLKNGYNIEVFIEGTRSRTGKLLTPKFGMLKIVLDSLLGGRIKDVVIVPMSIDYDRVVETETYVSELLGTPKKKESLFGLLNNANLLSLKLGRIDLRFAKEFYLSEWVQDQIQHRSTGDGMFCPSFDPVHRNTLLQSLGYKVLSDINSVSVIMPTALVGTVLLTLRGRGVGREELIRRVLWLKKEIESKKRSVAEFNAPAAVIVDRAVVSLASLIALRNDLLEPVYYVQKRFELSLYRNQVMHLFIHEALLCAAMYCTIKRGQTHRRITKGALLRDVTFLSRLLKSEFIFRPGSIENNLSDAVRTLNEKGVVDVHYESDGDYFIKLSDKERGIGRENFDFYCFLIWPFIETYWLAAASLFCIVPTPISGGLTDSALMKRTQQFAKTLYYQGDLGYFESINKETLRNAYKRYEGMGLLRSKVITNEASKKGESNADLNAPPILLESTLYFVDPEVEREAANLIKASEKTVSSKSTHKSPAFNEAEPEYTNAQVYGTKLWDFVEGIGKFRREGKHRRDNEVTGKRILRLARLARVIAGEFEVESKL